MAEDGPELDLYDPRRGDPALRVRALELDPAAGPFEPARTNCFAVVFVAEGSGAAWADAARFAFGPGSLLFFVPYQHVRVEPDAPVRGEVVEFHANFLCVETFHAEVGCSGVLFNDPYGSPAVALDGPALDEVAGLIARIRREDRRRELAHGEAMLAHLKVLLILATRIKTAEAEAADAPGSCGRAGAAHRHPVLAELRDLIERDYRTRHAPADYARRLRVTAKTLGRIVREHLGTTPTDLIRARVLTHAKWQLLHTLRPVKEIAREVGFADELYFSRLFKKATGRSPTAFREYETIIRGGSNLSMPRAPAPIPGPGPAPDTASGVADGPPHPSI